MFEQDRVISRLQQRVLRDPYIYACFLSGSFGRRQEDAYSDLDVGLVFQSETSRDLAFSRRREFTESVLPYVPAKSFDADHIRPHFHIALYANGAKVDYRFETVEELEPNPWDRDIRIIKDTNKWLENYQQLCRQSPLPPPPNITLEKLVELDNRFWVMFWDTFRLVRRGDHIKPFQIYLELVSVTWPVLFYLLPAENPAYQGLIEADYSADIKQTLKHLRKLLDAYLKARAAVVSHHRLQFEPNTSFETQIIKLVNR